MGGASKNSILSGQCLHEAKMPFGTMVGWKTPKGTSYGVVVGRQGNTLAVITMHTKRIKNDVEVKYYRAKKQQVPIGSRVVADLQQVPIQKARVQGFLKGAALKTYVKAAAKLNVEGLEYSATSFLAEAYSCLEETKWIQKAVKRPGRLPRLLGLSQDDYEALNKTEKIAAINKSLQALSDEDPKVKSKRAALLLGKRFIKGID